MFQAEVAVSEKNVNAPYPVQVPDISFRFRNDKKRTNVGIAEKYWKSLKGNPKITVVVNGSARIRPPPVLSAQTCHASQEES
jgi:hypothetical protein